MGAAILDAVYKPVPLQITGLVTWLKADAGTFQDSAMTSPVVADGNPVGGWQDQSGNGNHLTQSSPTKRPAFKSGVQNGKPVVRFDGVDDAVDKAFTIAVPQPTTIFLVCRYVVVVSSRFVLDGPVGGRNALYPFTSWRANAGLDLTFGTADTSWHVFGIVYSDTSSKTTLDAGNDNTGSIGVQSCGGISLGWSPINGGLYAQVDVGEVLLFNNALPVDNRARVRDYLNNRWQVF